MGTDILDERGVRRVIVFYKAAWYDRRADMCLVSVGRDVVTHFQYGGTQIPWAVLTGDERDDAVAALRARLDQIDEYPDIWDKDGTVRPRLAAELASVEGVMP